jgi:hypothetical protein
MFYIRYLFMRMMLIWEKQISYRTQKFCLQGGKEVDLKWTQINTWYKGAAQSARSTRDRKNKHPIKPKLIK